VEPARNALKDLGLDSNDKNTFLVMAAMVPGKKIELNEGIRLLTGKAKIDIPLKKKAEEAAAPAAAPAPAAAGPAISGPVTSRCVVEENGGRRTFTVTVEPLNLTAGAANPGGAAVAVAEAAPSTNGTPIYSTFAGQVEVVDIKVKVGDSVTKGQVVAQVEAMKAQHDIKTPIPGKVTSIHVAIGDEVDSTKPILTVS